MDKQADDTKTQVTDDQELANVLASMNQQGAGQADNQAPAADDGSQPTSEPKADNQPAEGLNYEETGSAAAATPTLADLESANANAAASDQPDAPAVPEAPTPSPTPAPLATASPELDSLKKDAVAELRPLVDKLDQPADEKFDTLLLIIRSTDDQSLLSAAHDAAKQIDDDTKRASALLDIIKEIDYFSGQK